MFFVKIIPLLVHTMIIKSKAKGLGNPHSYTISFILVLLIIHLIQIGTVISRLGLKLDTGDYSSYTSSGISMLVVIILIIALHFLLSKIYNRKKLGRWYVQYKDYSFMSHSKLIVFSYYFLNLGLIFLLILYFNP
jgi:hypothetical protein